ALAADARRTRPGSAPPAGRRHAPTRSEVAPAQIACPHGGIDGRDIRIPSRSCDLVRSEGPGCEPARQAGPGGGAGRPHAIPLREVVRGGGGEDPSRAGHGPLETLSRVGEAPSSRAWERIESELESGKRGGACAP